MFEQVGTFWLRGFCRVFKSTVCLKLYRTYYDDLRYVPGSFGAWAPSLSCLFRNPELKASQSLPKTLSPKPL